MSKKHNIPKPLVKLYILQTNNFSQNDICGVIWEKGSLVAESQAEKTPFICSSVIVYVLLGLICL